MGTYVCLRTAVRGTFGHREAHPSPEVMSVRRRLVPTVLLGLPIALALMAATGSTLCAQQTDSFRPDALPVHSESDIPRRATGSFLGSLSGFLAGALLTSTTTSVGPEEWSDVVIGGLIGSAVLAPVGAYLFDDEPGSLSASLAASAALTALTLASGAEGTVVLVVLPVGQLLTATLFGRGPG